MKQNQNTDEPNVWEFVEKWYPDYYRSDEIARANDLQCLIDGEFNDGSEAMRILYDEYNGDMEHPLLKPDYDTIHKEIYEKAIYNFLLNQNSNSLLS